MREGLDSLNRFAQGRGIPSYHVRIESSPASIASQSRAGSGSGVPILPRWRFRLDNVHMASWADLEEEAPELARFVRERLEAHKHVLLATLRADGARESEWKKL